MSAYLASSTLTSVTWTANYCNTADGCGSGQTQISTGSFTINSTLTQYTTTIALPASATNGVSIVFSTGAFTSGTLTITGVQLEPGAVATQFERRLYQTELFNGARYCQRVGGVSNSDFMIFGYATGANPVYMTFTYPVPMRAAATITVQGTWNTSNCGQPAVFGAGSNSAILSCTAGGAGYAYTNSTATTEYLLITAEL